MSEARVSIRWHGHACFSIVSPRGVRVVIDPFDPAIGYPLPPLEADVVVTTHNHYDHANVAGLPGQPKVLRGLTADGEWASVDETVGDVRIRTVGTYHDEVGGAKRGRNALVCLDAGGLAVVHCGDLGHALSDEQVGAVGPVDVAMIPVGNIYTVGAAEAREVARQLAPQQAIVPMHYATEALAIAIHPVEPFLRGWPSVRQAETDGVSFPLRPPEGTKPQVVVLDRRPGGP